MIDRTAPRGVKDMGETRLGGAGGWRECAFSGEGRSGRRQGQGPEPGTELVGGALDFELAAKAGFCGR